MRYAPQRMHETQRQIVGTWHLEAFRTQPPGEPERDWFENSNGLLIYTPDGAMAVAINAPVSPAQLGDPSEVLLRVLSYAGTYEVVDANTIRHVVTQASDPNRIGKVMVREVFWDGDVLCLVARGDFGVATLRWRKK